MKIKRILRIKRVDRSSDKMGKMGISKVGLQNWLNSAKKIMLVSGEGTRGTSEPYLGSRSIPAMKSRLTKERQGGDRSAYFNVDGRRLDFKKYWGD